MQPDPSSALHPGVAAQMAHLAVAVTAALGAVLATWLARRRLGVAAPPADPAPIRPRDGRRHLVPAAVILTVLNLLLAVGLRQVWPHPGLRTRALVLLIITLVTTMLAWWRQVRREAGP